MESTARLQLMVENPWMESHKNIFGTVEQITKLLHHSRKESLIPIFDIQEFVHMPKLRKPLCCIDESITRHYPIFDSGEQLISIGKKLKCQNVHVTLNLPDVYNHREMYLRKGAYERFLLAVHFIEDVSEGKISIKVLDAHSEIKSSKLHIDQVARWMGLCSKASYDANELCQKMEKWLSEQSKRSGHNTGGALDVTLVSTETGQDLPLGSSWLSSCEATYTWSPKIPQHEQFNRILLYMAMTSSGFVNNASEWWHYSFGDQYWATFFDKPYAHYGPITVGSMDFG